MAMICTRFDSKAVRTLSWVGLGQRIGIRRSSNIGVHLRKKHKATTRLLRCLHTSKMITCPHVLRPLVNLTFPFVRTSEFDIPSRSLYCTSIVAARTFVRFREMRIKTIRNQTRTMQTLPNNVKAPGDRDIENHLRRLKIPFRNGYTSIVAPCPTCKSLNIEEPGTRDTKTWNMFINKMTGKFICKKCGQSGVWNEIKTGHATDVEKVVKDGLCPTLPTSKKNNAKPFEDIFSIFEKGKKLSETSQFERELMHKRFETEILSNKTFDEFNIRITKHEFHASDGSKSLQICLIIPWYDITSQNVIGVKLLPLEKDLSPKILPRKHSGSLFGSNCESKTFSQVILTSSEFDAMAISQATGLSAVSLPAGTSVLPPEVLPQLEQFEKIVLWFGNDSRSKQAINQFSKKLDMERCSFVRLLEKDSPNGALDALNKGLNLKSIISKAKSLKHKEILTFNQLREDVLGEFLNADEAAGVKWKRFPGLSSLLKGHRRGELTILTGQTGTGKTTLLSEMSLDLCGQGINTLWGSFEIKNVRLVKAMICQYSGLNLETSISQFNYWADKFDNLPLYFMSYFGAHNLTTVLETMSHAAYVYDIEHIILDNLQFMMSSSSSGRFADRFSAMDHAIAALRNFASSANVHVTLVIHPRKENQDSELQTASIFGTAKASQEADNIIILQDTPGRLSRRYLQVTKNRFDGAVGKVPLQFNRDSLCMSGFYRDLRTGKERFMTSNSQGNALEKRDFVES